MKRLLLSLLTLLLMTLPSASATTQVWNGSFDSNYWWGCLDLDGSVFSVLKKGDKVVLLPLSLLAQVVVARAEIPAVAQVKILAEVRRRQVLALSESVAHNCWMPMAMSSSCVVVTMPMLGRKAMSIV